eukprot:8569693-Lingulodinium_polyedra.AAC.1
MVGGAIEVDEGLYVITTFYGGPEEEQGDMGYLAVEIGDIVDVVWGETEQGVVSHGHRLWNYCYAVRHPPHPPLLFHHG